MKTKHLKLKLTRDDHWPKQVASITLTLPDRRQAVFALSVFVGSGDRRDGGAQDQPFLVVHNLTCPGAERRTRVRGHWRKPA